MFRFFNRKCQNLVSGMLVALLLTSAPADAQDGYINARSFAESQGIAHQWFPIQKILVMRKGLKSVKLKLDDTTAIVDEKEVKIPAPPRIQDGQIMVPAAALARIFQGATSALPVAPPKILPPQPQVPPPPPPPQTPPGMVPIAQTPAQPPIRPEPQAPKITQNEPPAISVEESTESVLLALRHSVREDHTRVVLEFTSPITYRTDFKDGVFRLTIVGCRNLIPTKRTNPAGRDVTRLDINSGSDRKGLVLNFTLPQKEKAPTIETVASPFRMIVSLPTPPDLLQVATATAQIATPTVQPPPVKAATESVQAPEPPKAEVAPEINIEVEAAKLSDQSFSGRTIVIDPGHGGSDSGFVSAGRPEEKEINLLVAQHLKNRLETIGFKTVLTRTSDIDMPHAQRVSFANRNGGDLYISIHTGGANDPSKAGIACYYFSPAGYHVNSNAQGAAPDAAFTEWARNTRFDLALFLARKVNERMVQHMRVESRGVKAMPMLPLKFIMNPAVMIEVGMLSEKTEGKNLISDKYRQALANSIANAVVDFFNGIVIKQ